MITELEAGTRCQVMRLQVPRTAADLCASYVTDVSCEHLVCGGQRQICVISENEGPNVAGLKIGELRPFRIDRGFASDSRSLTEQSTSVYQQRLAILVPLKNVSLRAAVAAVHAPVHR